MVGSIVYFVQHKPDECIVWVTLECHEQKPPGIDGKTGNADPGQSPDPGHLSIALSALPCIFIMSTGSLALHYIKWDLGFILLFSGKNQHILLILS